MLRLSYALLYKSVGIAPNKKPVLKRISGTRPTIKSLYDKDSLNLPFDDTISLFLASYKTNNRKLYSNEPFPIEQLY